MQDGALPGDPTDVAQTPDGYLWVATKNGLARFDGVSFKNWHDLTGKYPGIPGLTALGVAPDGTLWVGAVRGLYKVNARNWKLEQQLDARINGIVKDGKGDLWAVRSRLGSDRKGPLCKLTPTVVCYNAKDGVKFPYGTALSVSPEGTPWMGSSLGISVGLGAAARVYTPPELKNSKGLAGVSAVLASGEDEAWVAVDQPPFGLLHLQGKNWTKVPIGGDGHSEVSVTTLYKKPNGELLIGTFSDGLLRMDGSNVERYDHGSGLSGDTVRNVSEDSSQNLWVVTEDGLDEFYQPRVVRLTKNNGIGHGSATTINQRANGDIWIGDHDRFDIIPAGGTHATRSILLPSGQVTAAFADRDDRLWAGLGQDLVRFDGEVPHVVQHDVGVITNILQDAAGNLWIKLAPPSSKVFELDTGFRWSEIHLPVASPNVFIVDGQPKFFIPGDNRVFAADASFLALTPKVASTTNVPFYESVPSDIGTWLATKQGEGLYKNGTFHLLTRENGLKCNEQFSSVEDEHHGLWLFGICGIQHIERQEILRWIGDPSTRIRLEDYTARDGVSPDASPFGKDNLVSKDGRVWFANESIVQVIDPAPLQKLSPSSPIFVENIIADHQSVPMRDVRRVPANTHDLQIDFTSIDLTNTDRMVFRYRLAPYDKDWVDVSLRRTTYYTGVPPGHYTFEVTAKPPHGDWSSTPASVAVDVLPAFYQTLWFRLLAVCTFLAIVLALFQLRIRYATLRIQRQMDTQMSERIRIARELHDTVLQGFYGMLMRVQSAANRLSGSDPARLAIEQSLDEAETTLREGRETIRELRGESSNEEDLLNALQAMAAGMAPKGTEEVSYRVTGEKDGFIHWCVPRCFE